MFSVGLIIVFSGACISLMRTEDDIKMDEIGNDELQAAISESLGFWKNHRSDFSTNPRCNFSCPMRMKLYVVLTGQPGADSTVNQKAWSKRYFSGQ